MTVMPTLHIRLPDVIVLHCLLFCEPVELVQTSMLSKYFHKYSIKDAIQRRDTIKYKHSYSYSYLLDSSSDMSHTKALAYTWLY